MSSYENETKQRIQNAYKELTQVERSIADFFVKNHEKKDFASKSISKRLYVSEATMTRFAQKCGYKGYREFIYFYEKDLEEESSRKIAEKDIGIFAKQVYENYFALLQENFRLFDEQQIERVAKKLGSSDKVIVFGTGSSGLAAREFEIRFMRLGMNVDAVTDSETMQMKASILEKDTVIMALSLGGETKEVLESMRRAKERGAEVVFITSNPASQGVRYADEIIQVAAMKDGKNEIKISPQFTIMELVDVLYSYYYANDYKAKSKNFRKTLSVIQDKNGNG